MSLKKLFLATSILLISLIVNATKETKVYFIDETTLIQLNGNVKQMSVTTNDGLSANPGPLSFDSIKFNRQGDEIERISESHMGVLRNYYTTQYSTDGKKLKISCYYKPNDILRYPEFFPQPTIKIKDTSWVYNSIYKYDEHGRIINYLFKWENIRDSIIYKYDSQGSVIESDYYSNTNSPLNVTKYIYDEKHELIESDDIEKNTLRIKAKYEYNKFDSEDNWVDETVRIKKFWVGNKGETLKIHREITYY